MPVLESQHSYEELKKLEKGRQCGECNSPLVLCWGGAYGYNEYMLRCARDPKHEVLARPYRPSPFSIPGYNLSQPSIRRRNQMKTELAKRGAADLMEFQGAVLNRQQADAIVNTLWPGAPAVEKAKAAMICVQYELNPLMKHIFLIPFGQGERQTWAVVLGIQANRLIAHRAGDFSYLDDTPRLMTKDEQIRIMGEADEGSLWAITKLRDSKGNTAQGYGNWPRDKAPYGTDKGNNKANMAFIRSERNAFDRLFAGKMPQNVEVADAQFVEISESNGTKTFADKETGEIVEAKATVKSEPAPVKAEKQAEVTEHDTIAALVLNGIKSLGMEPAYRKKIHAEYGVDVSPKDMVAVLKSLTPEQLESVREDVNEKLELK